MKTRHQSAFTLLELLLVISIIGVLSTLVAPAINTVMHGSRLTQAGDKVVAVLNQARQAALTSNHRVEVRFYQYGDSEVPGESVNTPATGKFRAIQAFEILDSGSMAAIGKMEKLLPSVIIDSNSALSSLLSSRPELQKTADWGKNKDGDAPKPNIPIAGTQYNCWAFRFFPDGSTNLKKTGPSVPQGGWFLTLHNLNDGDNRATPPPNYMTIKVDPVNGALKAYRP